MNPPNLEYKNLRGLLVLCLAARLVDIDAAKKSWKINQKFANILFKEMNKNLSPEAKEAVRTLAEATKDHPPIYDSYVASDSPPEGMAGDSLGNPEE